MLDGHLETAYFGKKRVKYGRGIIGDRKEFARLFTLEFDTEFAEEGHGSFCVESLNDFPYGVARRTGISALVHHIVRDIAAPAARDEDLGAQARRTVQQDETCWR